MIGFVLSCKQKNPMDSKKWGILTSLIVYRLINVKDNKAFHNSKKNKINDNAET